MRSNNIKREFIHNELSKLKYVNTDEAREQEDKLWDTLQQMAFEDYDEEHGN